MLNLIKLLRKASRRNLPISTKLDRPLIPSQTKSAVRIKASSINQLCWTSFQNHVPTSPSSIYLVSLPFLSETSPKTSTRSPETWLSDILQKKGPLFCVWFLPTRIFQQARHSRSCKKSILQEKGLSVVSLKSISWTEVMMLVIFSKINKFLSDTDTSVSKTDAKKMSSTMFQSKKVSKPKRNFSPQVPFIPPCLLIFLVQILWPKSWQTSCIIRSKIQCQKYLMKSKAKRKLLKKSSKDWVLE